MLGRSTREVQTVVKHELLSAYLGKWSGILINGHIARAQPGTAPLHLIYIEMNAYRGVYAEGDATAMLERDGPTAPVYGSPVLGIQALDKAVAFAARRGLQVVTTVILIEERGEFFRDLITTLQQAGYGPRLDVTPTTLAARPGRIVLINGDCTRYGPTLQELLAGVRRFGFVFFDPFGPTSIPYGLVGPLAALPRVDCLINLPTYDLLKKAGAVRNGRLAGGGGPAVLANWDQAFPDKEWRADAWRYGDDPKRLEIALVDRYVSGLRLTDGWRQAPEHRLVVKRERLPFPLDERPVYHLLLTTHDPTGALAMNEVLYNADLLTDRLRYERRLAQEAANRRASIQTSFFDSVPVPPPPRRTRSVDIQAIVDEVWAICSGRSLSLRSVYASVVDKPWFIDEVRQAIYRLVDDDHANFTPPLRNSTIIRFMQRPTTIEDVSATRLA